MADKEHEAPKEIIPGHVTPNGVSPGEEMLLEKPVTDDPRSVLLDIGKPPVPPLLHFFRKDSLPNLVLVLGAICISVALLLSVVYSITEPRISAARDEAVQEALGLVFPETLTFTLSPYDERVYEGRNANGDLAGFSVRVSPVGYGGEIDMIVGVNLGCEVTGVNIVSHRETKGYGTRVLTETWFLPQFIDKTGDFALGSGVDGITGATRSSAAVTNGVREAVDIILALLKTEDEEAKTP